MGDKTVIQWTDATWNPVTGCTKISPGCKHCYAETFAERWRGIPGHPYEQGFDLKLWPRRLEMPLTWKEPRMIFVNSMSDLFHEDVSFEFITQVWNIMYRATQHTFQVLTKRPERMLKFHQTLMVKRPELTERDASFGDNTPLAYNVWLGVSVENQATADERIPILLQTPAAVRFVSVEPLLEKIKLEGVEFAGLKGNVLLSGIHWIIVGGESGPGARPCNIGWIRSIIKQCKAAGVPVFVKQLGSFPTGHQWLPDAALSLRDRKGGDISEWPEDLRVREWPE